MLGFDSRVSASGACGSASELSLKTFGFGRGLYVSNLSCSGFRVLGLRVSRFGLWRTRRNPRNSDPETRDKKLRDLNKTPVQDSVAVQESGADDVSPCQHILRRCLRACFLLHFWLSVWCLACREGLQLSGLATISSKNHSQFERSRLRNPGISMHTAWTLGTCELLQHTPTMTASHPYAPAQSLTPNPKPRN